MSPPTSLKSVSNTVLIPDFIIMIGRRPFPSHPGPCVNKKVLASWPDAAAHNAVPLTKAGLTCLPWRGRVWRERMFKPRVWQQPQGWLSATPSRAQTQGAAHFSPQPSLDLFLKRGLTMVPMLAPNCIQAKILLPQPPEQLGQSACATPWSLSKPRVL